MELSIFMFLSQDGIISGAVYALLAVCFVLIFAVTRIIFIPMGDFVAFSGLTLAALERGEIPGSVWLLLGLGGVAAIIQLPKLSQAVNRRTVFRKVALDTGFPVALLLLCIALQGQVLPGWLRLALTFAILVPMGPLIYRVCFQPMSQAPVLVLLIASVGVHWLLIGLGLLFFGPEGWRTDALVHGSLKLGMTVIPAQAIMLLAVALTVLIALWLFFGRTIAGKALRAAAISQKGAAMVGISPDRSGQRAFFMAIAIGVAAGALLAPMSTVYYDSGFLIGLKGFVAAIVAGFASYPLAVAGAVGIGLIESFSAFYASAFKEVIVFSLIIPVLLWRSVLHPHPDED